MKKVTILILSVVAVFGAACSARAQVNMVIHLTNGDSTVYNVDSIGSMKLTPVVLPRYDVIYMMAEIRIPPTIPLNPGNVDSMQFGLDSLGHHILTIDYDTAPPPSNLNTTNFRLIGPQIFGPGAPLDFISFGRYEIDTNVIQLSADQCALWIGNLIYCAAPQTGPNQFFELDSNLDTIRDVMLGAPWFGSLCLNADSSSSYLLSKIVFWGDLQEYGIQTGSLNVINAVDEGSNPITGVSNAVYYRGGDDTIIFYAYGNWSDTTPNPPNAGYYLLDRNTGKSSMILHYISDLGENEMMNGFDVSPDGKTLLIGSTSSSRPPLVIEYNLSQQIFDTIPVVFDSLAMYDPGLWVRYSHDGTKILYSNYPLGTFDESVGYPGEIGIIDRATGARRALETNPTTEGMWVGVFPEWSPDDTKIVYSCAELQLEPPGALTGFQICILKTLLR